MIITFYSYKGGVGRSMALANIAELLYRRGLRVIVVDWDLEAPGLENYFLSEEQELEMARTQLGVIDLLTAYKRQFPRIAKKAGEPFRKTLQNSLRPITDNLYPIYPPREGQKHSPALWLLPAGWRAGDRFPIYAQEVQDFDWAEFYD